MDNHLTRPEVLQANRGTFGVATRYSTTLKKEFIYVALKTNVEQTSFIRVAQTMDFANSLISLRQEGISIESFFFVSIILVIFTLLVDRWVTSPIRNISRVAEKIKTGDWSVRSNVTGKDEIAALALSVNEMAETLGTDIAKIIKMSDVRSEFLINVTHELKTPIASISAYLETLLSGALEDKVNRSFLKRSLKNINRLEALVTDLVDISRIETGELTMNIDRVNILPIVEELVSDANENNDNKDISIFITNKDSQEINVQADPDRIHQVFDNLISNAIRYTDSGEIEIAINRKADRVNFSIKDTGIGIDNEALERIFERFYRTLTARSRVRSGTGLGLSIVKHIIEAHESNIEVKSVLGKGTTFSFELNLDHD